MVCGALIIVPAARAAIYPVPTVTSSHGTVLAFSEGACVWAPIANPTDAHICGAGVNSGWAPDLIVVPGETLTIALNAPEPGVTVTGFSGRFNDASPFPLDMTAQTVTVPVGLTFPAYLMFSIEAHDDTTLWHGAAMVDLVPGPEPAPAPGPQPATPQVRAGVTLRALKLKGRRLTVTAACRAAPGCGGTVTLKSSGLRIARLTVGLLANGAIKHFTANVSASRLRHLIRHNVRSLQAVITATDGSRAVSKLRLMR